VQKLPFSVLTIDALVEHIISRITDGGATPGPAFALILGAGFSYPLFPTAAGMVKQDMAWWKYADKHKLPFTDTPPENIRDDLKTFAQTLWAAVHRDTAEKTPFTLDATTGLPADGGDNITAAYQAIMSGRAARGFNRPEQRRNYFRALCKRVDKRINLAHLYLGSLLHAQSRPTWKDKQNRATFTQTILTTNFDPLLQRALQLHNVLYFMSDQPEGGITPPDDDEQAVHLVYTHGSVHRRHLANNNSEIDLLSKTNATALSGYLSRQGVIVIGYSGWSDTTFQALQSCSSFDGNLYWCGRERGEQAAAGGLRDDVKALLAKNTENRFYVELGPGGADDLLYRLHKALINALPTALIDPAGLMINEIASVTWPEKSSASSFDGLEELARNQRELLTEFRNKNLLSREASPEPPLSAGTSQSALSAASLNVRAAVAYHNGDFEEAIRYYTMVVEMPDATAEQRATALIYRGTTKGQMTPSDTEGEIADYSAVVAMPDAPAEQLAKALVNRGLAKAQITPPGTEEAITDYNAVVAMPDAPAEPRASALLNRGVAKRQLTPPDTEGAITDYNAVVAMPDAPAELRAKALLNSGIAKGRMKPPDTEGAITDCNAVLAMPDAPTELRADALLNRGFAKGRMKPPDKEGEITDYSAVIAMPDALVEQRAKALVNRGFAKAQITPPDTEGAITDCNAVLAMPDAPTELRADALLNRGFAKSQMTPPDTEGETTDYSAVVAMPDAPADLQAKALINRGFAKTQITPPDTEGALIDFSAVVAMPDAPAELRASALLNRGVAKRQLTPPDAEGAITDYTTVVTMPDAPAELRAEALLNRGVAKGQMMPPDIEGAIMDWSVVIAMPDAPVELRAKALFNSGVAKGQMMPLDTEGAITDYRTVVAMPDAPVDLRAKALINSSVAKIQMIPPDFEGAAMDCKAVLAMPDAPAIQLTGARFNLACNAALQGNAEEALRWLHQWRETHENPTRQRLNNDSDFDPIREDPAFIEFRDSLPDGLLEPS
jgi:tetratricopeptide (TPR) repeat protein